jgi:hypothetical protein
MVRRIRFLREQVRDKWSTQTSATLQVRSD